jgi:hypothetical protein
VTVWVPLAKGTEGVMLEEGEGSLNINQILKD